VGDDNRRQALLNTEGKCWEAASVCILSHKPARSHKKGGLQWSKGGVRLASALRPYDHKPANSRCLPVKAGGELLEPINLWLAP
jgi:hypothetical protein